MPKYRLLTTDELIQLEKIFINFLAANSITASDWILIKSTDSERMATLIEEFSDVVFEKTLNNVNLLEKRVQNKIIFYKLEDDKIMLSGIEIDGVSPIDFRNEFNLKDLNQLFTNKELSISFLDGTKPFSKDPKNESFALMESGAMISSNHTLFDMLQKLNDKYSEYGQN